jgi:hypothetical protein
VPHRAAGTLREAQRQVNYTLYDITEKSSIEHTSKHMK